MEPGPVNKRLRTAYIIALYVHFGNVIVTSTADIARERKRRKYEKHFQYGVGCYEDLKCSLLFFVYDVWHKVRYHALEKGFSLMLTKICVVRTKN